MNMLRYWVDNSREIKDENGYDAEGMLIFVNFDGHYYVFELDEDDGYRSHCDEWEMREELIKAYIREKGLPQHRVPYDKLEQNVSSGSVLWYLRAWNKMTVVFALGTDNEDDYYPSFEYIGIGDLDEDAQDNPSVR